jgi:protein translocase SecG subunit
MFLITLLLWLVFFASAVFLTVIVLLQESKGGGLAEAFGGTGAETFGVKSGGVNRFTLWIATAFMVTAVLIHSMRDVGSTQPEKPADPPGQGQGPGGPGGGGQGTGLPGGK